MRILFITPYYKPYLGGIERVIEKLSDEFIKSNQVEKVGVLTTHWAFPRRFKPNWPQHEIIDHVEVFRLDSWLNFAPPFFQTPLVWFSPWEIKKIIEEFQPDVVQLMSDRWFWGNFWAWFWGRKKSKILFSLSFHQLSFLQQFLRFINFLLTKVVNMVVVVTNHEKKLVKKAYFTPEGKFTVIPWGVGKKVKSQKSKVKSEESVIILSVGRLSKHKGQEWLVETLKSVSTRTNKKLKLVLIGEDEESISERLKQLAKDSSLELEITGKISEAALNIHYSRADIFVLFPQYEAFGLVFLEAMAHQVPVVTHKVGALEEVLKNAALLIEPYNETQAKVVLTKLIQDEKFREELGTKGFEYVKRNYSWGKTAKEFLRMYLKQQE